jgi:hypothetical protein
MPSPVWNFQYSVQCNASRTAAWKYWADVANWDDPPARFELSGPFQVGSKLTTILPDQSWHSIITHVDPEREAVVEMQLVDAVLAFEWKFEDDVSNRSRITQRLALTGPNASAFVDQVRIFEMSVLQGMKRLARLIEQAVG